MALQSRPPVITIMGHVDHGKTTLLDYIQHSRVAAGEAGGITQHIGAYQIEFKGKKLTFIDTPGHAAFNKMRERGATITDLVILVVAANDGVKPQTIESIRHIKNSNATVIVAINKIDLPDVYPDVAKGQLAEHGLVVQSYGGDVESIEISAKTGQGVDTLLETVLAITELADLQADPAAPVEAVVIEATKDDKRGPVASVIVRNGSLQVRQDIYGEEVEGRIRALVTEQGQQLPIAGPGTPVEIIGLKNVPAVGTVIRDVSRREEYQAADAGQLNAQTEADGGIDFDAWFTAEEKPKLKLIVKADVEGTLEVIRQNLDDESVTLISSGVGQVTEQDVELALTSGAKIIAFHIKTSNRILELAKGQGVKIKSYDVIYHLIEDLQKQILRLLEPTIDEVVTGQAEILQMFEMKGEKIAGCRVKTGEIKRTDKIHLRRNGEIIIDPTIKFMMHGKEEIQEVKAKNEFGITFKNKKLDFRVGDVLEAYHVEED